MTCELEVGELHSTFVVLRELIYGSLHSTPKIVDIKHGSSILVASLDLLTL